jgi:hypothetical protein
LRYTITEASGFGGVNLDRREALEVLHDGFGMGNFHAGEVLDAAQRQEAPYEFSWNNTTVSVKAEDNHDPV